MPRDRSLAQIERELVEVKQCSAFWRDQPLLDPAGNLVNVVDS